MKVDKCTFYTIYSSFCQIRFIFYIFIFYKLKEAQKRVIGQGIKVSSILFKTRIGQF